MSAIKTTYHVELVNRQGEFAVFGADLVLSEMMALVEQLKAKLADLPDHGQYCGVDCRAGPQLRIIETRTERFVTDVINI